MEELIKRILGNCGDLSQIDTSELKSVVNMWQESLCFGTKINPELTMAADIAAAELERRV